MLMFTLKQLKNGLKNYNYNLILRSLQQTLNIIESYIEFLLKIIHECTLIILTNRFLNNYARKYIKQEILNRNKNPLQ